MRGFRLIIIIAFLGGALSGCSDEAPVNLWDTRPGGDPSPVIQGFVPADGAGPGVFEITIQGQNFGSDPARTFIYFGSTPVTPVSIAPTAIKLLRPAVFGDSVTVKVILQNAAEIGTKNYRITQVAGSIGAFVPGSSLSNVATDTSGTPYVISILDRRILRVAPDGAVTEYASYAAIIPRILSVGDMRIGPNGFLYLQPYSQKSMYGVAKGGGNLTRLFTFKQAPNCFDFDQHGNIYAGGDNMNLNIVNPNNTALIGPDYLSYAVKSVRVFNNYVYVLADTTPGANPVGVPGIYRHQIMSTLGALGPQELVLAWSATGEYAASPFNDLTFSADGDMVVATNNGNPILVVAADGVQRSLYRNLLSSPAADLAWTGNRLYELLGTVEPGLRWIDMGEAGAPYYGR